MTIDVLPARPTEQEFRQHLADLRLQDDTSTRKRVATCVLLMGFGSIPSKEGMKELVRLDLPWMCESWIRLYQEFSGDISVVLADLMPGPETKPGKVMPKIPMPESRKFIGVYPDNTAWMATIGVGGKVKYLGRYLNPFDAALAYDKAARLYPSPNGKPRKTNFTVEPLACTPEPRGTRQISLGRAA